MTQPPTRQIYTTSDRITDFLQHIITQDAPTTILLICSTKEQFLEQLLLASGPGTEEHNQHNHILTKNTIGVLSKSSSIKLVYCPTLEHLRAYLSVIRSSEDGVGLQRELLTTTAEEKGRQTKQPPPPPPLMAILNPLALHVPTSEFSAQGLSRTFAAVVEVADRGGMDLVLCECRDVGNSTGVGSGIGRGEVSWHTQVPLLNSSVQVGEESTSYRGGGVPVKRVVQRWFEFDDNEAPITDTTIIDV
ncbi:hypothetical protein AKAW_08075 [Aspergillus niger]|uniref:Uncharacterized protein n=1 Tax=Aspergillus niger TaxID=5061 RepID=A0A100IND2_ASPNG|nr:hypothetical protein AKAW_08075 [Aspergillus niger]